MYHAFLHRCTGLTLFRYISHCTACDAMISNGQACELIAIVLCSKTIFGKASFDVIGSDGVSKTLSNAHQGCCGESCQLHCGFLCRQEVLNGKSLETTFTMYLHIVPEVLMDGLHDVLEFPSVVAVQQHSS